MKEIPLGVGKIAICDDEDYKWLNEFRWYAIEGRQTWYAVSTDRTEKEDSGKWISMHRIIMDPPDDMETDHIDSNGLHNWRSNLRICTLQQNQMGQKPQKNRSSKFKGVMWHKRIKKWQVCICLNKKRRHLGCFDSEIEATRAYDTKAIELFGDFARPNII